MRKEINNIELAELLRAVAASYQLKNEEKNRFRIMAYQRAADAVEHLTSEAKDLWDDGKLEDVPGIGPNIATHLDELFRTGKSKHFESLMKDIPGAAFELMKVPGIGVKTAYKLVIHFKIKADDFKTAVLKLTEIAEKHLIRDLPNFGEDSEERILKSLKEIKGESKRFLLPYAMAVAGEVIDWIKSEKSVKRADALGSLRRRAATIGDVDIAVATDEAGKVLKHFTQYPKAQRILEIGEKTAGILLPGNVHVDLMVTEPESYGSLLQHFTGSKHHNIALRDFALKKKWSLSEYGIKIDGQTKKFPTEEEFYRFLGMAYIEPELREDNGELQSALRDARGATLGLPHLVELKDIKADLQIHSNFDIETSHDIGGSSMEEVVEEADKRGYEYIAFTEHNPSKRGHSASQIVDILKEKREEIDKLNYSILKDKKFGVKKVYNSLEIDILPDGSLPVPEKALETLDFALVSIHSTFRLPKDEMTARVIRGLSHPKVRIFAHPTARKLGKREGIEIEWEKVFDFCLKENKWLEINGDPARLDLPDVLVKEAVKRGVRLTMGTDSHHALGLQNMEYAVYVARRGWAEKKDIINTENFEEFDKMIKDINGR